AEQGSTITRQIISGSIFYIDRQTVVVQIEAELQFPNKSSIRIESFNVQDPLDCDDNKDKTIDELHKEIQIKSNVKDKKINNFI
ncbi:unnamed protein product, partial [Allacma fusca]